MKFGEFVLELFIFAFIVLILYLAQPGFAKRHPDIARLFSPDSATPKTGEATISSGAIAPSYR